MFIPRAAWCYSVSVFVFQVIEGLDIVQKIERSATDRNDRPKKAVVISDAGEL